MMIWHEDQSISHRVLSTCERHTGQYSGSSFLVRCRDEISSLLKSGEMPNCYRLPLVAIDIESQITGWTFRRPMD